MFPISRDLRYNKLRHLGKGSFSGLPNLGTLLLNNNEIRKLKKGAFHGMANLRFLHLQKNRIDHIDDHVFRHLSSLEHLYLGYNSVIQLSPNVFNGLVSLNRLFLDSNQIESLPSGIFKDLKKLNRLNLGGNPLQCGCPSAWLSSFIRAHSGRVHIAASCLASSSGSEPVTIPLEDDKATACERPFFVIEPRDSDVLPGGTISLACRISSASEENTSISWTKNGSPVTLGGWTRLLQTGTLRISEAKESDVGVYVCKAGSELISRPARVRLHRGRAKPRITYRPVQTEVRKGETIVLNCGASGFPRPTFEWYKDGGRLSNAHDRFEIATNGSLIITNAQVDDAAHYRCSVTNYLGRASSAARVRVNLADTNSKPIFTSKPRNVKGREDGFVEFTCVATGQPYPDYSWWNNNRLVNSNHRITVSNGGQHLRIQELEVYDTGDYTCRAENSLGRAEVAARLTVVGRKKALKFTNSPHDMSAPRGATVQLPCRAEGSPSPTILWLKDGREMLSPTSPSQPSQIRDTPHFRQSPSGNLVLYNVSAADSGTYECVADNGQERRVARAVFTITRGGPVNEIVNSRRNEIQEEEVLEHPVSAEVSYNPRPPTFGDGFVLVALDQARSGIDRAINATIEDLFQTPERRGRNATTMELIRIFRYPPTREREAARAAEVYERTLELLADHVKEKGDDKFRNLKLGDFSYEDLVSPANLEVIGNLSGCESHRAAREANCSDLCFHSRFRSADGSCNARGQIHSLRGASLTAFRRLLPAEYENGFNSPRGKDSTKAYNGFPLPGARRVSSLLASSTKTTADAKLSHMVMQWGQFLDHDLGHSMEAISRQTFLNGITCGATCEYDPPCFPIEIPEGDPRISPNRCMEFTRSSAACGSGPTSIFFSKLQPREQINQLTSYIDASQVYGSESDLSTALRNLTNEFGRLREGPSLGYGKPLLPFNDGQPIDCRRDPTESSIGCFLAGDVRANEQVALLSMHTLWFREHNRLVTALREMNPHWSGERLYQEARKIVGAQMQHITYDHWLPLVFGEEGMEMLGQHKGYSPSVDASLSNVFAASAFRFGHTMINPILRRLDANFDTISEGDLPLRNAFFAPWRIVQEGGVDPVIRGLFTSAAKENVPHEMMTSDLTERLFEVAHAVALDLGALNIQRGRDHGLPSYTAWRDYCGFPKVYSWDDMSEHIKDAEVLRRLAGVYGHPDNVDVWVGGLLENSASGGKVGPTVRCLLLEQFKNLRDGDRFWYENPSSFTSNQLAQIKTVSLGSIVCDNGDDIATVTKDLFARPRGKKDFVDCNMVPRMALEEWFECPEGEDGRDEGLLSSSLESRRFRRETSSEVDGLRAALSDAQKRLSELEEMIEKKK